MNVALLDQFAAAHHGLITLDAATRAGVSRSAWYRRLGSGEFELLHPGVARMPGAPVDRRQTIAAAVLAAAPGAMASHRSAAFLWGVPRPDDDPIEVIVNQRNRGLALDSVIVHRPRDRKDLTPVLRQDIHTSNVLRWMCDLGAVDAASVPAALAHVVTAGFVSPMALQRAVEVHARCGRAGVPALREALREWFVDGKPTDSRLESTMKRVLARADLPAAEFHARIAGFEVDFWLVGTRVVLECDGRQFHGVRGQQFERDRDRDSALQAAGYITVRFTFQQITRHPAVVVRRIRNALQMWPGHPADPISA